MDKKSKIQNLRNKLKNKEASIGSWIQISNASIAEIMGSAGYDWIAVDLEHGNISSENLPNLFRSLELGGTLPFARLSSVDKVESKKVLDAGAAGIIIPNILSPLQLTEIIRYSMWPPSGKRGVGFSRANLYGKNFNEYLDFAQTPVIIAMIEDYEAIQYLDEILKVKGLDAIFIGPYDLSASMNLTGEFENKQFIDCVDDIKTKCLIYKIPIGIHVVNPDIKLLEMKISEGFQFIAYSIDTVFLNKSCINPIIN
jgi:2-dehydro-3-deoxyglucarate aldolase